MTIPVCLNCMRVMVIHWRLNPDGDQMSRAVCEPCGESQIFTAAATPKASALDVSSPLTGARPSVGCAPLSGKIDEDAHGFASSVRRVG